MTIYQCLFFSEEDVAYWENLEAEGDFAIQQLLRERLARGEWSVAEAWRDNELVCRVVAPR
jgi:hypothetical protein